VSINDYTSDRDLWEEKQFHVLLKNALMSPMAMKNREQIPEVYTPGPPLLRVGEWKDDRRPGWSARLRVWKDGVG